MGTETSNILFIIYEVMAFKNKVIYYINGGKTKNRAKVEDFLSFIRPLIDSKIYTKINQTLEYEGAKYLIDVPHNKLKTLQEVYTPETIFNWKEIKKPFKNSSN